VKKAKDDQTTATKAVKKEKETSARTGGYDEQQISQLKAVSALSIVSQSKTFFYFLGKCSSCN
jgi:hypothetical protein